MTLGLAHRILSVVVAGPVTGARGIAELGLGDPGEVPARAAS